MIQKVFEIDPLLCPFCGGEVKILFIIKPKTSRKSSTQRIIVHRQASSNNKTAG